MELRPEDLERVERYKLLIGCVVPRPIALVSTVSPQGTVNVAPFSFFNAVSSNPMMLVFCPANRPDGSEKDSLVNARSAGEGGTGEFVVNVTVEEHIRRMVATSEDLPFGESELELSGLTTVASRVVAPPRVAESPVAFECRTESVTSLAPGAPLGGNLVLGRVVHVYLRDGLADERLRVDPGLLRAVGRMGGTTYVGTRDRFDLPRGRAALEADDPFRDHS